MPRQKTNLDVVAKMAGVSTATVSRVINGKPGVSREKAEEIQDIIRRMKFQPVQRHRSASRETVGARYGNVAIFVLGWGHYDAPELLVKHLDAISRACLERQINPILVMGEKDPKHLPPALERGQIDGALVFGDPLPPSLADLLKTVPVVWMTSHHEENREVVLAGNFEIGQVAADYLASKSCRQLLALNPFPGNPVLRRRCAAFLLAAEHRGLPATCLTPQQAVESKADPEGFRRLVLELVEQIKVTKTQFDGVFLPDDLITAVTHPVLKEAGFLKQGNMRIISCGNESNYLLGLHPRPASIDIGPEILGDQAVRLLLRRAQGEERNVRVNVTISPRVVEGSE